MTWLTSFNYNIMRLFIYKYIILEIIYEYFIKKAIIYIYNKYL